MRYPKASRVTRLAGLALALAGVINWVGLQTPRLVKAASTQSHATMRTGWKETVMARMVELDASIAHLKALLVSSPYDKYLAGQLNDAISEYESLSAQLGGDRVTSEPNIAPYLLPLPVPTLAPAAPLGCTSTLTTFSNNTPLPIADVSTQSSNILVSGVDSYLLDVDLTTFITHTFAADLDITLTSPAGTIVTITTDNGAGNDNVFNGTVWDDSAGATNPPGPVTDATFANNVVATPLVPEEALGAFIGEDPNGTWTLTITDDLASDTGSLNSWSLDITTLSTAPTDAPTVTVTNSTPTPIIDVSTVTSNVMVSGAGTYLRDVNMTTFITHTFAADLDITLTSPAGTVVTITTDNGAGNDNVFNGTVWDDSAGSTNPPGPVTDATFANNVVATPLVPEEAMGAFVGEDPNGTWTLTVTDDLAGDTGTLNSWSLDIVTTACDACASDTEPPMITCPANISVVGSIVNYSAPTVSDNCPGITVVCTPASGSTFPPGITTVTCTATDASDNTASCSFTVSAFDGRLQDDSAGCNATVVFASIGGAYQFCTNGATITGTATKVTIKGSTITLEDNRADRRVSIKYDASTHRGSATLQNPIGVVRCSITDRNTLNDTCSCP
jgi:subtilisin-like proprotein convertase family protein